MNEVSSKQSRKVTVFAIILSLISIGVLIFGFTIISSDKVVMIQSVTNLYNKLTEDIENDDNLLDKMANHKALGISSDITINTQEDSTNIKYNYLENKNDLKSSLSLNIANNLENILDSKFLLNDDKIYAYLDGITPSYYYTDFNYISILKGLKTTDYEDILLALKNAITDSISNDDINKEKVTISYNGSNKKVNKLSYVVDKEELVDIATRFISSIKKNKNLVTDMSSLFDMSYQDFTLVLDNILTSVKNLPDGNYFSYNTYYYGFNKIVEYELYIYDYDIDITYKVEKENDTVNIKNGDSELLNLTIKDKKYTFNGNSTNIISALELDEKIDLEFDLDYNFEGTYDNNNFSLILTGNNNPYKIEINNSLVGEYKYSTKVILTNTEEETELYNIDINTEFNFDKTVEELKMEAKSIDELTEEELTSLEETYQDSYLYRLLHTLILGEYDN